MEIRTDEVADGIYRFSTFVPDAGIVFNQFLVDADEPLLFHAGMRGLFPLVAEAMAGVIPVERLRWISFGHYEADECGAMNEWMALAPNAQVAHTALGVMVSVADQASREPRPLADGEVIDLGGKRVRHLSTPHVPHGWDAHVLFEETTSTLLCGDLFTHLGDGPALTSNDVLDAAAVAEDVFGATALTPNTAPTIRALADLRPTTLAIMHGSSYTGDASGALLGLADFYEQRLLAPAN